MNHDDDFIRLRADITEYLMQVGAARGVDIERDIILPNVVPITQKPRLPDAYARAAGRAARSRFVEF